MKRKKQTEYDSLTKEIEIQSLKLQFLKNASVNFSALELKRRDQPVPEYSLPQEKRSEIKKNELDDIVAETERRK